MATTNYGTIRPADVNPNDIEIIYGYTPSREVNPDEFLKLDSTNIEKVQFNNNDLGGVQRDMGGMYNLTLPKNIFNQRGYYDIYIRPKETVTTIADCGVLATLENIKGLVLDSTKPELQDIVNRFANNGLAGYRIEYLDNNNQKIPNLYRTITSSNRCEAVTQNLNNTTDKAIRYRLTVNGSLVFLTVSPSSASAVQANVRPFIGEPNQKIVLTNTFFDPIHLEINLTDVTLDTIGDILLGNQTVNKDKGIYTLYRRRDSEIFAQYNTFRIKDEFNPDTEYEVRERRENIDLSEDFETIKSFDESN